MPMKLPAAKRASRRCRRARGVPAQQPKSSGCLHVEKPQDQWPQLQKAISELEQDGFQPEDILLLTPFKVANSQVLQALMEHSPQYSERMCNVASVKGLEAPVVVLVDMGASAWAANPKVEYVGASRVRVKVVVFTTAQSVK